MKLKMNQCGQGFEVFKLLIAAIVAVFILTIMLQILSNIKPPTQGNPNQEASSKIKSLVAAQGTPERTGFVIFNKDNQYLNSKTIAQQTGSIQAQQICLDISDAINAQNAFETEGVGQYNSLLKYKGTGNQSLTAKLLVLCDSGDTIDQTKTDAGIQNEIPNCSQTGNSTTVCYVSVVPTQ